MFILQAGTSPRANQEHQKIVKPGKVLSKNTSGRQWTGRRGGKSEQNKRGNQ